MQFEVPKGFSLEKARKSQIELSKRVIRENKLPEEIDYVAGVDVAYLGKFAFGAVAVFEYTSLKLVETKASMVKTKFPYIPTLLSFREISPAIAAIKKLNTKPDVFLVDGQGVAHPFRFGFASHLGVVLNKPTIGVAKSLLCGKIQRNPEKEGEFTYIYDNDEVIGAVLLIKKGFKPIYISVGHMVSLENAIKIVKKCVKSHRVPEPIRMAHIVANEMKKCRDSLH